MALICQFLHDLTEIFIAKNLIVTAGHCTGVTRDPRNLIVVFSRTPNSATAAQSRKVLGGKAHDNWARVTASQDKNHGDVAVLRFEGVAPEGYAPAAILGNPAVLKNGGEIVLAGFGATNMTPETYPEQLLKTTVKLSDAKYSQQEVAFEQHEGRGACHGDSGGPAYVVVKGKLTLMGVTSRSLTMRGGRTCLEGSIYTSTAGVKDFLVAAAKHLNSAAFVPGQPIPQPVDEE